MEFTALNELDETTLYELILSDDLTYEGIIREIIKEQNMDPWNIDVGLLTAKYLEFIQQLKKIDFRISGKILLTAAILLKMKSDLLMLKKEKEKAPAEEGVSPWDKETIKRIREQFGLVKMDEVFAPRLPLPRKRGLTIDDLIGALSQAMDVKYKRDVRIAERHKAKLKLKVRKIDILSKIRDLYNRITNFFAKKERVGFKELIPSQDREDIIWTFIPLLHLANSGKVGLEQEEEFGDIHIIKGYAFEKELNNGKEEAS